MDWKVILRKCLTLNQMKHRFSTAYPPSALVHLMVTLLRLFRREIKAKRAIRNWGIPQHRVDLKYRRECWLRRRFSHNIFWENSITFHSWRIKLVFVMADNHSHLPFSLAHRYTISKIISWLKKGRKMLTLQEQKKCDIIWQWNRKIVIKGKKLNWISSTLPCWHHKLPILELPVKEIAFHN